MSESETRYRAEYVAGLRAAADFLEQHPEAPVPLDARLGLHCTSREEFVTAARALGRARKDFSTGYAMVERAFGPVTISYQASRSEVCERVVIGTREVEVQEPDPEAVASLPKVTRTEVVEDVEWRCMPILAEAEAA